MGKTMKHSTHRAEREDSKRANETPMVVGARVRMSGRFLRSTGQAHTKEAARIWTILACPCALCSGGWYVAVDEPADLACYEPAEIEAMPWLRHRHINKANLVVYGQPSLRNETPHIGKVY